MLFLVAVAAAAEPLSFAPVEVPRSARFTVQAREEAAPPRLRKAAWIGAVSSVVLGGVLYGAAFATAGRLDDATTLPAVEGVQARTNTLTASGLVLGAAGGVGIGLLWVTKP